VSGNAAKFIKLSIHPLPACVESLPFTFAKTPIAALGHVYLQPPEVPIEWVHPIAADRCSVSRNRNAKPTCGCSGDSYRPGRSGAPGALQRASDGSCGGAKGLDPLWHTGRRGWLNSHACALCGALRIWALLWSAKTTRNPVNTRSGRACRGAPCETILNDLVTCLPARGSAHENQRRSAA
jgi:hypothetical protein